MTDAAANAAAFAAVEAIRNGQWDAHLDQIGFAVLERKLMFDQSKKPAIKLPAGQVWAWMNGPGIPHWEVRGTGALW